MVSGFAAGRVAKLGAAARGGSHSLLDDSLEIGTREGIERRFGRATLGGDRSALCRECQAALCELTRPMECLAGQQLCRLGRQSQSDTRGCQVLSEQEDIGGPTAGDGGDYIQFSLATYPHSAPDRAERLFGQRALRTADFGLS